MLKHWIHALTSGKWIPIQAGVLGFSVRVEIDDIRLRRVFYECIEMEN